MGWQRLLVGAVLVTSCLSPNVVLSLEIQPLIVVPMTSNKKSPARNSESSPQMYLDVTLPGSRLGTVLIPLGEESQRQDTHSENELSPSTCGAIVECAFSPRQSDQEIGWYGGSTWPQPE
mgnify:CR=1 FL=1